MIIRTLLVSLLFSTPALADYRFLPTTSVVNRHDKQTINVSHGIIFYPDGKTVATCIGRVDYVDSNYDYHGLKCWKRRFDSAASDGDELQTFPAFTTAETDGTERATEAFWQFSTTSGFLQFCFHTHDTKDYRIRCEGVTPEQHE